MSGDKKCLFACWYNPTSCFILIYQALPGSDLVTQVIMLQTQNTYREKLFGACGILYTNILIKITCYVGVFFLIFHQKTND